MKDEIIGLVKNAEELGRLKENTRVVKILLSFINDKTSLEHLDVLKRLFNQI